MKETNLEQKEGLELELPRLVEAVWKKLWLVILMAFLGAVIAWAVTYFFITPQYESSVVFYVNTGSMSVGETSVSISSGDLVTSRNLVDSYLVILKTRGSLLEVIRQAGIIRNDTELKKMITASAVNNTEFFQVTVTSSDPFEAERIANAIGTVLPQQISGIIEGTQAKVVEEAIVAAKPSAPSYGNNLLLGLTSGLVLSLGGILLQELFDTTIRGLEDISRACACPVLTVVPDMKKSGTKQKKKTAFVGRNIGFAAAEAYKVLRTKLQFSFADEGSCRIIGVSSALTGEGKSISAVNLAYTLSQLDKKVLLIDCDMRRPSVFTKLPVKRRPGLSDFLAGQSEPGALFQPCGLPKEEEAFAVITGGQIPPNPMELLNSARMAKFLNVLRQHYDYVILDLPPVGEVGDALAVAREIDGYLLVVRQNGCTRTALHDAVRQFAFVEARILGILYNGAAEEAARYGKGYHPYSQPGDPPAEAQKDRRYSGRFLQIEKGGKK